MHIELPAKKDASLIILTSIVSTFFMSIFNILAFIPLQIIALKRGQSAYLSAAILALVLSLFFWFRADRFIDVLAPLSFFFALCVLNARMFGFELPAWARIASASLVAFVGTAIVLVARSAEMNQALIALFEASPALGANLSLIVPGTSLEGLLNSVLEISYRSIVFNSGLSVLIAYCIGRGIATGFKSLVNSLDRFFLPNYLVWGCIASLLGIMIAEFLEVSIFAYFAWNAFLVICLLYFLKGLSVARVHLKNTALFVLLLCTMLIPGINFLSFICLSILGIASVWIPQNISPQENVEYEGDS